MGTKLLFEDLEILSLWRYADISVDLQWIHLHNGNFYWRRFVPKPLYFIDNLYV